MRQNPAEVHRWPPCGISRVTNSTLYEKSSELGTIPSFEPFLYAIALINNYQCRCLCGYSFRSDHRRQHYPGNLPELRLLCRRSQVSGNGCFRYGDFHDYRSPGQRVYQEYQSRNEACKRYLRMLPGKCVIHPFSHERTKVLDTRSRWCYYFVKSCI